ncbi:Protein of unknown function [Lentibacillus halodurans]|uniref:DUF3231 family protein n=1 Tax=Lentibacillus halodurans TaxID=237679 RepID=A0A1I0Y4P7_9BACI|nr:DUF3231 family protein [Lentibacillus halodurans]SFB07408.1 Protein of unknown function [Lentibacillus halodurans]
MTTPIPISSSELGTLWIVYQKKTMMLRVIEHFMEHSQDPEVTEILQLFHQKEADFVIEIAGIFRQEGAAVPVGYTENDIIRDTPPLFDELFSMMYLRLMMKIASGIHALHLGMSYRQDLINLYRRCSEFAEDYCEKTTQFLLDKGVLQKSPAVNLPERAVFAKQKDYRSGFSGHKRSLNTVEVSYLYQGIESNVTGMKLMTGFSQVAKEKQVQKYFFRGKELSKKIISKFGDILLESDVNVPVTAAGLVTNSRTAPFSDKLMMYNTSLLTSFGLGSNMIGTSFSLRKDLPLKMITTAKDVFNFANDGGDIMIEYGWTEEPPQMEDRTQN